MKIGPVGTELFNADGRTDRMTKLTVDFRSFPNAPKKNGVCRYDAVLYSGINFVPLDVINNMTIRLVFHYMTPRHLWRKH